MDTELRILEINSVLDELILTRNSIVVEYNSRKDDGAGRLVMLGRALGLDVAINAIIRQYDLNNVNDRLVKFDFEEKK